MVQPTKPTPRTARIELKAPYEGFYAVVKIDFPARVLVDLQSNDFAKTMEAFGKIVVEHNLTDSDGVVAAEWLDVDPVEMASKVIAEWGDELGKLQPR